MSFATLAAAFTSDLTRPISWRRLQLEGVHDLIQQNFDELVRAALVDVASSESDVLLELALATQQASLAIKSLKSNFKINNLRNTDGVLAKYVARPSTSNDSAAGLVLIRSLKSYPYASLFSALIAAISAGNVCAIVCDSSTIKKELSRLLPQYLDRSAFAAFDASEVGLAAIDALAASLSYSSSSESVTVMDSIPAERAVAAAYVHQGNSKTIESAAISVVRAREAFHGKAPFSPSIVFVHEGAWKTFLSTAEKESAARGVLLIEGGASDIATYTDYGKSTLVLQKVTCPDTAISTIRAFKEPLSAFYPFVNNTFYSYIMDNISTEMVLRDGIPVEVLVDFELLVGKFPHIFKKSQYNFKVKETLAYTASSDREVDLTAVLKGRISLASVPRFDQGDGKHWDFFEQVKFAFKTAKVVGVAMTLTAGYFTYRRLVR